MFLSPSTEKLLSQDDSFMLSVAEKEDDYQDIFNSLGGFGSGIDEENNGKVKEDGDEDDSNCLAQLLTTRVRAAPRAATSHSPSLSWM